MSLFVAPVSVIKKLEKLFRNILWNDKDGNHKSHLVKYDVVTCEKSRGGLGVKKLQILNSSLIMKWLWRFGTEKEALWRIIIAEKYGEEPFGWNSKISKAAYGCSVWKGICKFFSPFSSNIRMQVGDGNNTSFWGDRWIADIPLREQFPAVYAVCENKGAAVAEVRTIENGLINWNLNISRRVHDNVINELTTLLHLLDNFQSTGINDLDYRVWQRQILNGTFSVKSCYH